MSGVLQVLAGSGARALSASITPASVGATRATAGTAVSDTATCGAVGGYAPYSYAWSYVSGDAGIACATATASATTFSAFVGPGNVSRMAVWQCTVTDGAGSTASATVAIDLEFSGGG